MRILGIDPGYAIVGWGVIQYEGGRFTTQDFGAVTTAAETPFPQRLQQIYQDVTAIIQRLQPNVLAIEKLYFKNNQKTAIEVAEARGVILLAAQNNGIPIFEYTPLQVKSAVTGFGQAQKPQVMEMTKRLLRLTQVPKPDDTADALAIAICHAQMGGTALKLRIMKGR